MKESRLKELFIANNLTSLHREEVNELIAEIRRLQSVHPATCGADCPAYHHDGDCGECQIDHNRIVDEGMPCNFTEVVKRVMEIQQDPARRALELAIKWIADRRSCSMCANHHPYYTGECNYVPHGYVPDKDGKTMCVDGIRVYLEQQAQAQARAENDKEETKE